MSTVTSLEAAKAILETRGWTKGEFARDAQGRPTEIFGGHPTCYCALGALYLVNRMEDNHPAVCTALRESAPERFKYGSYEDTIAKFNDHKDTTKEDVLAWFDRAIQYAKENFNENV